MKNLYLIPLLIAFFLSIPFIAQETDAEGEPTTIQGLLQLVQEGRTTEQNENTKREQTFLAEKNKQASILAAEKRELARQERIADQLEAEYKKNEEILKQIQTDKDREKIAEEGKSISFHYQSVLSALNKFQIDIVIDLGIGDGRGMAWGSDLTEEYVIFNSAYTT